MVRQLHQHLYLGAAFAVFYLFYPVLYFLGKNNTKNYRSIVRLRRLLALWSAALVGISFRRVYEVPVDWSRNYIIMANHTSILDITAVIKACPVPMSFMGKVELLDNPVTGYFFMNVDISVDRSSKISSFRAFKRAETYLNEGKSLVIFPEGGISDSFPPILQDFKSGGFRLATELKIPVLPVIIEDAWQMYWDDGVRFGTRPGRVNIRILAPIEPPDGLNATDELRDKTFNIFKKYLRYESA